MSKESDPPAVRAHDAEPLAASIARARGQGRKGELAIVTVILSLIAVVVAAIAIGAVGGEEGLTLALFVFAFVGGAIVAFFVLQTSRSLEAPGYGGTAKHPGWYRYRAGGGAGGVLAIVGLLVTVFLRQPMLLPLTGMLLVAGAVVAVFLHRRRARTTQRYTTLQSRR